MSNKSLFASRQQKIKRADTINHAGGAAYRLSDKQKLAQLAATGTLSRTFYASAGAQLDELIETAISVEPEFVAKTAIYARQHGHMKDTPALLLAVLASTSPELLSLAFPKVIGNGRMLRNFVQIMRSGAAGRTSLGTRPKKLVQAWLNGASDELLLRACVGKSPALADVIKMVHPTPINKERDAFFAWILGQPCDVALLPQKVRDLIAFRENPGGKKVPDVPFQMLTSLDLSKKQWKQIALNGEWQMVRMNLNTFARHGALGSDKMINAIVSKLTNSRNIARARVFPYQLMAAWKNMDAKVPKSIRQAIAIAMERAIINVPEIKGRVVVCPDVSGSMWSPVTGYRQGSTTKVNCIDVAALMAAAVLRKNPSARVMPFDTKVHQVNLRACDKVVKNAEILGRFGGGGTACSAPLIKLNKERAKVELVILVSDNESWADRSWSDGTRVMEEWDKLKRRNPKAKLVCLDIVPNTSTPAHDRTDVLNIGGFSDAVFEQIASFAAGRLGPDHWVGEIDKIEL